MRRSAIRPNCLDVDLDLDLVPEHGPTRFGRAVPFHAVVDAIHGRGGLEANAIALRERGLINQASNPDQALADLDRTLTATPGDLAATIYQHLEVPLDGTYLDHQGRPRYIVENGAPIAELV